MFCAVFARLVFSLSLLAWPDRYNAAADIAAHRLKAVEYCAVRGGRWENGQFMELITPDGRGAVSTPAGLSTIVAERKKKLKLNPESSGNSSQAHARGSFTVG